MMLRIILPPGPMTSRILSTGIRIVTMRGAKAEMFSRDVRERFVHLVEDVQPAAARLLERLAHHLGGDAADLDVHLQRRDAVGGAGDLEVHVAVVILGAGDVGEHGVLAASSRPSPGPSRCRRPALLSGTPASIIASDPPQTDAIDDEPFDSRMSETMRTV